MKQFLSLVLAFFCVVAFASVHQRPRTRHPSSAPRKTVLSVPWKTVAAGGTAVGTVIAAYKVSDGIEDGIKTVAKEKPEVVTESLSVLTWPLRWGALILFILIYCEVLRRFICKVTTLTTKGSKKWNSH